MKLFRILTISLLLCTTAAYAQPAPPAAAQAGVTAPVAATPAPPGSTATATPGAAAAPGSAAAPAPAPTTRTIPNPANPSATLTVPILPALTPEQLKQPFAGSFFLTPVEVIAVQQALEGRVTKTAVLQQGGTAPVIPPHRVIRIAGVFYRSPEEWIVWMNNKKVTPDELLPEIMKINVKPSSKVSLEWYDIGLNKVISITLRPHQTYDITTGILLPQ